MKTIQNKQVADLLTMLHEKANADSQLHQQEKQRAVTQGETLGHAWTTAYLAISQEEGQFLHFLASLHNAKNIVEFGCSFGISTIYLAAAAKDIGGTVITTDIEESKVLGTRKNLEAAGLSDIVEVLQGDALQTLATIQNPIDFLFLDGAKPLYLPIFNMLLPLLTHKAIIFADNTDKAETKPFVDDILQKPDEFTAIFLFDGRALIAFKH